MTTYLMVTIDYGPHAVNDSSPVVHAMDTASPHVTMCGKRPLRYVAVPGQQVTCVKCLMAMPDEAKMARSRHVSAKTPKAVDVEKRGLLVARERRETAVVVDDTNTTMRVLGWLVWIAKQVKRILARAMRNAIEALKASLSIPALPAPRTNATMLAVGAAVRTKQLSFGGPQRVVRL